MGNFWNARTFRAFGIAIPIISLFLLWNWIDPQINIYNTGVTPGIIMGFANIALAVWIYKNRI